MIIPDCEAGHGSGACHLCITNTQHVQTVLHRTLRYREERIHELESRLARRCGETVPDNGSTTENVSPEEPSRDNGNNNLGSVDHRGFEVGAGNVSVGVDTQNNHSKLEQLSRQRREIDAAIAAAMEESYHAEGDPPSGNRSNTDHEPPNPARKTQAGVQGDESESQGTRRSQRRLQSSAADSSSTGEKSSTRGRDDAPPKLPIGKPPLAPSRSGGRPRYYSGVRRHSSASEVEEAQGGSISGDFPWGTGDCCSSGSIIDEVQTDETGMGSNDSVGNVSDVEESVWEEIYPSRSWDGDEGRIVLEEGVSPDSLLKEGGGGVAVRSPVNHNGSRHRQRHRVRSGTQGNEHTYAANSSRGEGRVPAPATRIVATNGREEGLHSGSDRTSTRKVEGYPVAGQGDLRSLSAVENLDISSNEAATGTYSGGKGRELNRNSRRHRGLDTGGAEQSNNLARVPDSSAAARVDEARRRHRIRQDDSSVGEVDEDRWKDMEESKRHPHEPLESPVALRDGGRQVMHAILGTNGIPEERHEVDDDGSYESRWSLSAEDEPPEKNVAENGAHARGVYGGDRRARKDGSEERMVSAYRRGQEHGQGETSPIVSEIAEATQTQRQGTDVFFGVVSRR